MKEEEALKFTEAKETGKPVVLMTRRISCGRCYEGYDNIIVYAMPDGTKQTTRRHGAW